MTDRTARWVLAREYAQEHGFQAAFDVFGTTGYLDEDMKIINGLPPVVIQAREPRKIVLNVDVAKQTEAAPMWKLSDGLAAALKDE